MNFKESVNYLYSLGQELSVVKFGLENSIKLFKALGSPEKKYFKVQIAGTNGKGSTAAFLEAICLSAGLRTGLTISPHLVSITERIRVNGLNVDEEQFAASASHTKNMSEQLVKQKELRTPPSFFEQVIGNALYTFAQHDVEIAILETGLGGRLDSTTAAHAEIAGITRIDLDHTKILGGTIEEIAFEKAAIIQKSSEAVVIGLQSKKALPILEAATQNKKLTPIIAKQDYISPHKNGTIAFTTTKETYNNIQLNLKGEHQYENALTAILLAEQLQKKEFAITKEHIVTGLNRAQHPGRLEYQNDILFDGAHNVSGVHTFAKYIKNTTKSIDKPLTLIFGSLQGKDISSITSLLFPLAQNIILVAPTNHRALSPQTILESLSQNIDKQKITTAADATDALKQARYISQKQDSQICVTGSLYLIGDIKKLL